MEERKERLLKDLCKLLNKRFKRKLAAMGLAKQGTVEVESIQLVMKVTHKKRINKEDNQ
jgi:hypothetical protein